MNVCTEALDKVEPSEQNIFEPAMALHEQRYNKSYYETNKIKEKLPEQQMRCK